MPRLGVVCCGLGDHLCLHVVVVMCVSSTLREDIDTPKEGTDQEAYLCNNLMRLGGRRGIYCQSTAIDADVFC